MELALISLIAVACSTAMSILAFMIGRCGRKLPIDGMLPRVVYSARFSPETDRPRPAPEPPRPSWPSADKHRAAAPHLAGAPPPQNSKLCATTDTMPRLPPRRSSQGSNHLPAPTGGTDTGFRRSGGIGCATARASLLPDCDALGLVA